MNKLITLTATLTATVVLTACEQVEDETFSPRVTGAVIDGPVAGARIYVKDCFDSTSDIVSTESLSADDGRFEVTLNDDLIGGLYCAHAVGGEYLNTATGDIQVLEAGALMTTPFYYHEGQDTNIAITPFTTLMTNMIEGDLGQGGTVHTAFEFAYNFVSDSLGGIDPIATIPITRSIYSDGALPSVSDETAHASAQYSIYLAALESYAESINRATMATDGGGDSQPSAHTALSIINMLTQDYSDGAFDGMMSLSGQQVSLQVGGNPESFDAASVWLGLANGVRNIDLSTVGIDTSTSDQLDLASISSDLLAFEPGIFVTGSAMDRLNEQSMAIPVELNAIPNVVSGELIIDPSPNRFPNATTVEIWLGSNQISFPGDTSTIIVDTSDYSDGEHQITYLVTHADGSISTIYDTFTINNSTPFIATTGLTTNLEDDLVVELETNGHAIASVYLNNEQLNLDAEGQVSIPSSAILSAGDSELVVTDSNGEEYRIPLQISSDTTSPDVQFDFGIAPYLTNDGSISSISLDDITPEDGSLIVKNPHPSIAGIWPTYTLLETLSVPYLQADWIEEGLSVVIESSVDGTPYQFSSTLPGNSELLSYALPIIPDTFGPNWVNYFDAGATNLSISFTDRAGNTTSTSLSFNSSLDAEIIEIKSDVINGEVNIYDYVNGNYALVGVCTTNEQGFCRTISETASDTTTQSESFLYVEIVSGTHIDPYTGEETEIVSVESSDSPAAFENGPLRAITPREGVAYTPHAGQTASHGIIVDPSSTLFTSLVLSNDDYSGALANDSIAAARQIANTSTIEESPIGTGEALEAATETFETTFGFNPVESTIADLTDSSVSTLSNDIERSLLNGSISQLADNLNASNTGSMPINVLSVTDQLAEDLADGSIDGMDGNGRPIAPISGGFSQPQEITSELVSALVEFSNSNANQTSISDNDLFSHAQTVSTSVQSNLRQSEDPAQPLDPINYSQDLITLNFDPNLGITGEGVIRANISDVLEYDSLTVDINGTQLPATVENGILEVDLGNEIQNLPSGAYELTIALEIPNSDAPVLVVNNLVIDTDNPEFTVEYSDASFWNGQEVTEASLESLDTTSRSLIYSSLTNLRAQEKSVKNVNEKGIPNIAFYASDNFGVNRVYYRYTVEGQEYSQDLLYENQRYVLPLDLNYLVRDGFLLPNTTSSSLEVVVEDNAGNTSSISWSYEALSHTIIDSYNTVDIALDGIDFYNRHLMDNRNRTATQFQFTNTSPSAFYIALSDNSTHTAFETFDTAIRVNRAYIETAYRLRKRSALSTDCEPEWREWENVSRLYNYGISGGRLFTAWDPINATSSRSRDVHDVYADDGIFPAWQNLDPGTTYRSGGRNYDFVTDTDDLSTAGYWGCSGENYAQYQNAQIYHSIEGYPRNETGTEALTFEFGTVDLVVYDNTAGARLDLVDGLYEIPAGHSITVSKIVDLPDMRIYNHWDVADLDTFRSYEMHRLDSYLVWEIRRPINVELRVTPQGRSFYQSLGSDLTIYTIARPENLAENIQQN